MINYYYYYCDDISNNNKYNDNDISSGSSDRSGNSNGGGGGCRGCGSSNFRMTSVYIYIYIIKYWINLDQPNLICQIHNLGYETIIIL
jgi:hypothetical protein